MRRKLSDILRLAHRENLADQVEEIEKYNDGETVCPPELVGNYPALSQWSIDTLAALLKCEDLPIPGEYREHYRAMNVQDQDHIAGPFYVEDSEGGVVAEGMTESVAAKVVALLNKEAKLKR